MKIRCLIVDDEPLASNVILKYLEDFPSFEVLANFKNALEAHNYLTEHTVDVIFMDINMPKLTGMEFVKSLKNPPLIVFTTAYREFAVESFELDVLDYLVKPFSLQRFMKTINRIEERLGQVHENHVTAEVPERKYVFFKVDKKMVKVYLDEILYIESLKDYVRIKTYDESLINHNNLVSITEVIPMDKFVRIHRSFIIPIDKVKLIDGNQVKIADKLLPIGRNYQKEVKELLLGTEE